MIKEFQEDENNENKILQENEIEVKFRCMAFMILMKIIYQLKCGKTLMAMK